MQPRIDKTHKRNRNKQICKWIECAIYKPTNIIIEEAWSPQI